MEEYFAMCQTLDNPLSNGVSSLYGRFLATGKMIAFGLILMFMSAADALIDKTVILRCIVPLGTALNWGKSILFRRKERAAFGCLKAGSSSSSCRTNACLGDKSLRKSKTYCGSNIVKQQETSH